MEINGRECKQIILPYSKDKVYIYARFKGKDIKKIQSEDVQGIEVLKYFIANIENKDGAQVATDNYLDELDLEDLNFLSEEIMNIADRVSRLNSLKKNAR